MNKKHLFIGLLGISLISTPTIMSCSNNQSISTSKDLEKQEKSDETTTKNEPIMNENIEERQSTTSSTEISDNQEPIIETKPENAVENTEPENKQENHENSLETDEKEEFNNLEPSETLNDAKSIETPENHNDVTEEDHLESEDEKVLKEAQRKEQEERIRLEQEQKAKEQELKNKALSFVNEINSFISNNPESESFSNLEELKVLLNQYTNDYKNDVIKTKIIDLKNNLNNHIEVLREFNRIRLNLSSVIADAETFISQTVTPSQFNNAKNELSDLLQTAKSNKYANKQEIQAKILEVNTAFADFKNKITVFSELNNIQKAVNIFNSITSNESLYNFVESDLLNELINTEEKIEKDFDAAKNNLNTPELVQNYKSRTINNLKEKLDSVFNEETTNLSISLGFFVQKLEDLNILGNEGLIAETKELIDNLQDYEFTLKDQEKDMGTLSKVTSSIKNAKEKLDYLDKKLKQTYSDKINQEFLAKLDENNAEQAELINQIKQASVTPDMNFSEIFEFFVDFSKKVSKFL
ncbi:hypothetical protein [Mycoplasma sp. Ms02]|uniref:hypothetical protein n=1 Tax=Mycoplasma sp. Ms02 TaxID=353851 RepID=UPI001C8AD88F|nr:hypothetical protein [Mycoplasma sp. Ms02]QZE12430.1 hypothetical protein K4L35_00345 [Mycoplasma sp. Ms02]